MKKLWHENEHFAPKRLMDENFMHVNIIFMRGNFIFLLENVIVISMHRDFMLCMEMKFSCMNLFSCMDFSCHDCFMHKTFRTYSALDHWTIGADLGKEKGGMAKHIIHFMQPLELSISPHWTGDYSWLN